MCLLLGIYQCVLLLGVHVYDLLSLDAAEEMRKEVTRPIHIRNGC